MNALRFLTAVYWLATFIAALVLSGFRDPAFWQALLVGTGLVFYVIAAAGLLMAHAKERRPVLDLAAVLAYPVLAYQLAAGTPSFRARGLWVFVGYFQFLALTGGFFLGIVLAPAAARFRSFTGDEVRSVVRAGLRFVTGLRLTVFALVLFAGAACALWWLGSWFVGEFGGALTARGQTVATVSLVIGGLAIAAFTFRHTVFNLLRDDDLRRRYTGESH